MYTLSVENPSGERLMLTDNPNYTVYNIEGLNPPQASLSRTANSGRDGSQTSSARIEGRNLVIYIALRGDIEASRLALYRYFPVKKVVSLYFKNGRRDVFAQCRVELFECDLFAQKQVAQISLICDNPYFEDVKEIITSFSDVQSLFTFPFSIPEAGMEFSIIKEKARKSIVNPGDASAGIIIQLHAVGTVENPTLYDILKRKSFGLNYSMQDKDTIIIDTSVGAKSVTLYRDGEESNILGHLKVGSEWFELDAGDNVFAYDCDSGSANLQITFTTRAFYMGV